MYNECMLLDAIRDAFESILDAVVPLKERSARTKKRSLADIPLSPAVHDLLGTRIVTLIDYREREAQDMIRALKYDASPHAARLASALLADYLREEVAAVKAFTQRHILLVPIPLHPSRARERGFNQIELALRALPKEFKDGSLSRLAPAALARIRPTGTQTKLSRRERIANVDGAFSVILTESVNNAHVFLVDDVTTTGATLMHAGVPLEKAGATVVRVALARA